MSTATHVRLLVLGLALAATAGTATAATIKVMPGNLAGWNIANFDDATASDTAPPGTPTTSGTDGDFVSGPDTPPLGAGSFREVVGTNGNDATRIRTSALNGTALSALTDVSYSTYVTANVGGQATYIQLRVDLDGNGTTDDILFFEPVYQNGTYGMLGYSPLPVPDQCAGDPACVVTGTWQAWDADAGGWWSANDSAGGPPLTTLANYATQYPNATLATDSDAVRLTAGFGAGAWDRFDGNVDALTIGGTTYDFEVCTDGPLYVDDPGGTDIANDCTVSVTPCLTIQHAVDVACPGATINVAAGTYTERVRIAKSVHVIGAGRDVTTVQAPPTTPAAGSIVVIVDMGTSAEIAGLTVSGPGPGTCDSIGAGILVSNGAVADIHDNAIRDIRDEPLAACNLGYGVVVQSASSATVRDNLLSGYQRAGIWVLGASTATIDGNEVTGGGNLPLVQNGIQVTGNASAQVTGNTVTDHLCDGGPGCGPAVADIQSSGILGIGAAAATLVSGNTALRNDLGIAMLGSTNSVTNNRAADNRYTGIYVERGSFTVTGNEVTGNVSHGIAAFTPSGTSANAVATLGCNRIEGNGFGIWLEDQNTGDAFVPTITGSDNAISGNTIGANNTTAATQNLENNYWGSNSGPNPPGSGDTLVGPIDAVPFRPTLPACLDCTADADCDDGLGCNGNETCAAGDCQAGQAIVCMPTQCQASSLCQEPGTCATTAKPDDVVCNDGQPCTVGDSCQAGVCTAGAGADSDGDGDCDDEEAACGCNPADGREICALANRLVGLPGSGAGEVLFNWQTPSVRRVPVESDPSCQASGVCTAGRCTAGRVNDLCTVNADCDLPADSCRLIVNYADVPDLALQYARVRSNDVSALFQPMTGGCSRKIDLPLDPNRTAIRLRLRAIGTIQGRLRHDRDVLLFRR